jgi:CheY-like chemotaxis protein
MDEYKEELSCKVESKHPGPLVLVVDDKPDQRLLYKLIMERLGVSALIVASGEQALDAAKENNFDVAIMDWQMPDMDGLQCQKQLRAIDRSKGRYTPVLCASARVMTGDRERALAAGMDDFIGKPFSIEELRKILFGLLETKTAMTQKG